LLVVVAVGETGSGAPSPDTIVLDSRCLGIGPRRWRCEQVVCVNRSFATTYLVLKKNSEGCRRNARQLQYAIARVVILLAASPSEVPARQRVKSVLHSKRDGVIELGIL
jgi:hypothetical protein